MDLFLIELRLLDTLSGLSNKFEGLFNTLCGMFNKLEEMSNNLSGLLNN